MKLRKVAIRKQQKKQKTQAERRAKIKFGPLKKA